MSEIAYASAAHRRPPPRRGRSSSPSSAAWPVRSRKTSSSVGRRTAMSSMPIAGLVEPRAPPRRSSPRRWRDAARAAMPSSQTRPLVGDRPRARRSPLRLGRRSSTDVEPVAADLVLELVGRALGDHAARGRSRRCGRRGGRPRRGTAWSAAPWCRRRRASSIISQRPRRLRGSRPVVGSSRNSTGGRATSAAARSSRRRMPPE